MDTKIIELRMAVRALPTSNRLVSLAVKSEVLRLSELLNSQYAAQQSVYLTAFGVGLLAFCAGFGICWLGFVR